MFTENFTCKLIWKTLSLIFSSEKNIRNQSWTRMKIWNVWRTSADVSPCVKFSFELTLEKIAKYWFWRKILKKFSFQHVFGNMFCKKPLKMRFRGCGRSLRVLFTRKTQLNHVIFGNFPTKKWRTKLFNTEFSLDTNVKF